MVPTEVIAMRLNLIRQRPKNRGGVPVGVCERGGGRIRASSSRTSARPHLSDGTPQAALIVGSAAVYGSRAAVLRRNEGTRFSSPSDDEEGGWLARSARSERQRAEQSNPATVLTCPVAVVIVTAADCADL